MSEETRSEEFDSPRDTEDLHYVTEQDALDEESRAIVDIQGREIAVFNVGGEYYALANYCVHQGGPLCEGKVSGALTADEEFDLEYARDGEIISCPWHGWEFDITTGEHLAQTGHRTPTYDVVLRDGKVFISL